MDIKTTQEKYQNYEQPERKDRSSSRHPHKLDMQAAHVNKIY